HHEPAPRPPRPRDVVAPPPGALAARADAAHDPCGAAGQAGRRDLRRPGPAEGEGPPPRREQGRPRRSSEQPMSAADVIRARLAASASASGTDFRVEGLTARGGYAVVAPAAGVATDGYLPEETAELFAAAP